MGNIVDKCCSSHCLRIVVIGNPKKAKEFYSFWTKKEVFFESNQHYEFKTKIVGVDVSLVLPLTTQIVWPEQIVSADGFIFLCDNDIKPYYTFIETYNTYNFQIVHKTIVVDSMHGVKKNDERTKVILYHEDHIVDKEQLKAFFKEIKNNK